MMPVVAGEKSTRWQILFYAVLLLPLSAMPWWIGGTGEFDLWRQCAGAVGSVPSHWRARVGIRVSALAPMMA